MMPRAVLDSAGARARVSAPRIAGTTIAPTTMPSLIIVLGHDVLGRDEEQQQRPNGRQQHPDEEHHPDDRPERQPEQHDLARLRDTTEQQHACPAEGHGQELADELRTEREECCKDGHVVSVGSAPRRPMHRMTRGLAVARQTQAAPCSGRFGRLPSTHDHARPYRPGREEEHRAVQRSAARAARRASNAAGAALREARSPPRSTTVARRSC